MSCHNRNASLRSLPASSKRPAPKIKQVALGLFMDRWFQSDSGPKGPQTEKSCPRLRRATIRDETTAALSLDLPKHARFAALGPSTGGLRGKDHTRRTAKLLEQLATGKRTKQRELILLKRSSAVRWAL